jgi:hypothetical protein
MTDWTPEEDEAFNEVEKNSNLGKQILRGIEGQPYLYPSKREWVGLTNDEVNDFAAGCHLGKSVQGAIYEAEAKLKQKNIG